MAVGMGALIAGSIIGGISGFIQQHKSNQAAVGQANQLKRNMEILREEINNV